MLLREIDLICSCPCNVWKRKKKCTCQHSDMKTVLTVLSFDKFSFSMSQCSIMIWYDVLLIFVPGVTHHICIFKAFYYISLLYSDKHDDKVRKKGGLISHLSSFFSFQTSTNKPHKISMKLSRLITLKKKKKDLNFFFSKSREKQKIPFTKCMHEQAA